MPSVAQDGTLDTVRRDPKRGLPTVNTSPVRTVGLWTIKGQVIRSKDVDGTKNGMTDTRSADRLFE